MLAYDVHLTYRRAGPEQGGVNSLLVFQCQARGGQAQQGRAAARDQRENEIVGPESLDHFHYTFGRLVAAFIGNGMSRFHDLYPFAGNGVAVARDDESFPRARPQIFDGLSHCSRRLSRADDDGAPLRRRGKIDGNPKLGRSGANGRIEHRLEQLSWLTKHWTFPATPRTGRRRGIKLKECRPESGPAEWFLVLGLSQFLAHGFGNLLRSCLAAEVGRVQRRIGCHAFYCLHESLGSRLLTQML